MAQDAAAPADNTKATTTKSDEEMTEILVTGIRKALQTSQELKKEADTVIDSITATDIGAFPDKSVAEVACSRPEEHSYHLRLTQLNSLPERPASHTCRSN